MAKKKHGDRRDGIWLRDLPAMNQIMPTIMPNRADNEAYIDVDVDLRPLEAYLARKNEGRTEDKITFFHVITAAIGKAFVLRPRMNRFICNHKVYQRRNITVAFVVKKKFEDKSEEGLAFLEFEPEDHAHHPSDPPERHEGRLLRGHGRAHQYAPLYDRGGGEAHPLAG